MGRRLMMLEVLTSEWLQGKGRQKTRRRGKRKRLRLLVLKAKVDVAPEKVFMVLELQSSSDTQAVDVSNMDVALAEVQYSVSRSESCAESIYGTVVLDQDEDTIQRILIHCFSTRVYHGQETRTLPISVTVPPSIAHHQIPTSTTHSSASNLKTLSKSLQSHSSKTAPPSRISIDAPCIVSFPQTSEIDGTREAAANQSSLLYIPLPVNVLGCPLSPTTKQYS
ncbi:hypothetical protein BCR33DRAFT_25305 [Rhizoclosmatium globosum]|uniref:Uncharacterized protein n=1 Tax=Rhizoclosmatium globosum TaxID=329046 RepID=A0A1Y2AXT6_9FUNG|nr:hypothetical protein BCR33DRAFT_25305 [Rhizoclosmatium globosum]|eukprot:ORY27264.1 hypothetical protein BCR33DRAFT_25305 [Rhizoclosmatium globosum]